MIASPDPSHKPTARTPDTPGHSNREDPTDAGASGPAPGHEHRSGLLRGWRRLPAATTALAVYVLLRAVGLVILWIFAQRAGVDFWQLLHSRYDALWYQQIAAEGYDHAAVNHNPDGSPRLPNLTFFPLYPGLIAMVAAISPFSLPVAGLIVSWAAGLAAAWGIYAVGRHIGSHAVGVTLTALWAVLPHAVVQNMGYTETLFTALVAWSLYALLCRRWLTVGLLCLVAGLSRPTATTLVAAVGLAALVAIVRRQDGWRPWVAALLAPIGYLGHLAWVGHRLGQVDGYFQLQDDYWRIGFDGGANTLGVLKLVLTRPVPFPLYTSTLLLSLATVLAVLLVLHRYPLPVVVYSVTFLLLTAGTAGYYWAKGRYLVPAFTLLLPVAMALAKARRSTQVTVIVFLVLASGWYGTYLSLIWHRSP